MTEPDVDLEVSDLHVAYGHVIAVDGVSLEVPSGTIVAMLGANGAGKTSMLRAISGSLRGTSRGVVRLFGEDVLHRRPHRIVKRGMVLVPEGRRIVAPLTVEENLQVGGYQTRPRTRIRELLDECYTLFPVLAERKDSPAGLLSGGEQQMLAFGRALMGDPKLILMDEPSMGLSPAMVDRLMGSVQAINGRGTSILLVEQNATAALTVADRAYVIDQGRIVGSGSAEQVAKDPIVAQAFLGLREEADEQQAPGGDPARMPAAER
jgi:branched-chain amino acid transport system ATP-binding protein